LTVKESFTLEFNTRNYCSLLRFTPSITYFWSPCYLIIKQITMRFVIVPSYKDTIYFNIIHSFILFFLSCLPVVILDRLTIIIIFTLSLFLSIWFSLSLYLYMIIYSCSYHLGLASTHERKHMTFALFLPYFTKHYEFKSLSLYLYQFKGDQRP
jgi:hypothetical protein